MISDFHIKHRNLFQFKETVFPFISFSGADTELGPEMKSTGEVMGRGENLEEAFLKAQVAAYQAEIKEGHIFYWSDRSG